MRILVTGGCGFIGSHFVEHLLRTHGDDFVVNVDSLTYAAHPDTSAYLQAIAPDRYRFVQLDIASPDIGKVLTENRIEAVVNFAAESHVDRSILEPALFIQTNVLGVQNLLHWSKEKGNLRFVQVSTDEVYGSLSPKASQFTETSSLHPNSPYAASKASADLLALAWHRTFRQPVMITRCSNNFGPFQFPEKLLPLVIANALEDMQIPVYGDGKQVRDWIYVKDHCAAVDRVLRKGKPGEVYNIGASREMTNLELITATLGILRKPKSLMKHVGDRPAHDRRYGINSKRIRRDLKWKPAYPFKEALKETIEWYQQNRAWWSKIRGKDYYAYYRKNYDAKFKVHEGGRR